MLSFFTESDWLKLTYKLHKLTTDVTGNSKDKFEMQFAVASRTCITTIVRADQGFFLGGGALVSCSTSTPINHIVFFFFAEYQLY